MLMTLLSPNFSEEGSNARRFETEIYELFSKYTRLAASGQRGAITLGHILQFITGSDEEPLLAFRVAPSIEFVEATSHGTNPHTECPFLPTATCAYQDVQMIYCCQLRSNFLIFMIWPLQMYILESCNFLIMDLQTVVFLVTRTFTNRFCHGVTLKCEDNTCSTRDNRL